MTLAAAGNVVWRAGRSRLRPKKGAIVALDEAPPEGRVVICLDELGPASATSHPGHEVIRPDPTGERRGRATQEIDYGRRGKGYVFGAFQPATGAVFPAPYPGRTIANWGAFLAQVDRWIDDGARRVSAGLANLSTHRALAVLLWALAHPRWAVGFQPTSAAYLHLIAPWWQVLRALARNGRRCASWSDACRAVAEATTDWNAHRHPFVWGQRRRRRTARPSGLAQLPLAA